VAARRAAALPRGRARSSSPASGSTRAPWPSPGEPQLALAWRPRR
jgi:hypothetical protein